jgi:hypothetical protein
MGGDRSLAALEPSLGRLNHCGWADESEAHLCAVRHAEAEAERALLRESDSRVRERP